MYVDPDPECHEDGWGEARSTVVGVTAALAAGGAYAATYGLEQYFAYTEALPAGVLLQFAVIAAVLVAHEAVHAVAYATVGGCSRDEIAVEAGIEFGDGLDPVHHSVHPTRPIRRSAYWACLAAPTLLLGVVPAAVGLLTGSALATFVGVVGLLLVSTDVAPAVTAWRHPERVAAPAPSG
ncbi:DUF3267 domain-containing protein [Haloarchaeobius baliensis]|uniref:DUF3267 domain-containing protein n=1 Tax=Haloarchaeobius baliensis TaxID=1670458 RepID=UPI003F885F3C